LAKKGKKPSDAEKKIEKKIETKIETKIDNKIENEVAEDLEAAEEVKEEAKEKVKAEAEEEKAEVKAVEKKTEESKEESKKASSSESSSSGGGSKKKKTSAFWSRVKVTGRVFLHFTKLFLIFTVVILTIAGIVLAIYNNSKKSDEAQYLIMSGKQVEVNGKYLHYVSGGAKDAKVTLVFLHGDRTTDDSVALQPLWKELEDECAYIYVDRSGCGFSDASGEDRDVASLVEETRTAIEKAGAKAPYILVPEGTAGIMALYWADKWPDEVKGIFGLSMVYPEEFDGMKPGDYCGFGDWITMQLFKIGMARLFGGMKPTDPAGIYTEAQMNTRSALVYKGAFTKDMYNEDKAMVDSAKLVEEMGWPKDIPITVLYGNPIMEPYLSLDEEMKARVDAAKEQYPDEDIEAGYYEDERAFYEKKENVTMVEISGPVRVAIYAPKEIAKEMKSFVEKCGLK